MAVLGFSFGVQFMIRCANVNNSGFQGESYNQAFKVNGYVGVSVGNEVGGHLCSTINWTLIYLCFYIFKMGDAISNI